MLRETRHMTVLLLYASSQLIVVAPIRLPPFGGIGWFVTMVGFLLVLLDQDAFDRPDPRLERVVERADLGAHGSDGALHGGAVRAARARLERGERGVHLLRRRRETVVVLVQSVD